MAEYTALYEAAQAVVELLRQEMTPEPISKPELIGLCAPYEPEDFQLTVYLYAMEEEPPGRDPAHGFVQEGRQTQRMAPLALNLHLALTAHSKAPAITRAADEYRILGRAMQVIRDHPDLAPYAAGSLAASGQPIRLSLEKALPPETLPRIWSGSNKPYKLSFGCLVQAVRIDSERVRTVARVRHIRIETEDTSR